MKVACMDIFNYPFSTLLEAVAKIYKHVKCQPTVNMSAR